MTEPTEREKYLAYAASQRNAPTVDEAPDIAELETMPRSDLEALCRRVCGARWGKVAGLSEDEAYDAVSLKMLHGGLTEKEINKALPPLREWMDRKRGRPKQNVEMNVNMSLSSRLEAAEKLINVTPERLS